MINERYHINETNAIMLWANPLSRPNIVDNGGGKMRTHQELRAVKLFYALHIAYIYIQAREQLYTCPGMLCYMTLHVNFGN